MTMIKIMIDNCTL